MVAIAERRKSKESCRGVQGANANRKNEGQGETSEEKRQLVHESEEKMYVIAFPNGLQRLESANSN